MLQPTRLISTPFAQEGDKTEIQNVTGEFDNSATYRLGFPPLTMQSIRLGGKPPKGTDFNGVLFDITENISFLCKGGRYQYNAGLSTLIGGYPEGSNLLLDDNVTEVVSTVAGNQNNPNTDMTGWTFKPNRTTAEYVLDASGETQQQVNYNGGSKWHSRVGGYLENERVVLATGDIVKSTIDANANDPNVDMTGWVKTNSASQIVDESGLSQQALNDLFKTSQVIDTRLYGVVANTFVDMTLFIHDAFADNPKARVFYFPEGEILCNIVIPWSYICLKGQGLGVTKLIGFDGSRPTINYNKKLYMGLKGISVHQRHDATASIINARDSRYIIHDEAEILQLPDSGGVYHFSVRGMDMRKDTGSWTGYNYFNKSRYNRCSYGIDCDYDGDVASVMQFDDCVIAWNGYFGARLIGAHVGGMNNCDIATNGQIGVRDGLYGETQFGGVYVKGHYFHITKAWHEFNRSKFSFLDVPNDIYIHPDSVSVTETNPRSQRSNVGGYVQKQSQAEQDKNLYDDTIPSSGMGKDRQHNLIVNGAFKYTLNGWTQNLTGTTQVIETADLPKGFETGIKITNATTGIRYISQPIYTSGGIITDLSKWVGKTITVSFWVKNLGTTDGDIRCGFDTNTVGSEVYFAVGSTVIKTPINEWVKVTITHTITGTEPRIFVGIRSVNSFITTGWECEFGTRVNDYEPKVITENGGNVLGSLKVGGADILTTNNLQVRLATATALSSATNVVNTDKRHPSLIFNTTNGKMYFSAGAAASSAWRCTDGTGDITPV